LETHTRWSDFVKAVNHLQALGRPTPIEAYNSYSAVTDLLLDVYERIRDRSGLVHDQQGDVFFLEDAAARALPAAVVAAGRYGDSIIVEHGPAAGVQTALLNAGTYRALLDLHSDEVGDDVSDAVDATASQTMSNSLLGAVERFRTSIEALEPTLSTPVTVGGTNDESSALQAKAQEESSATALSSALFDEIGTLVTQHGQRARGQEQLALLSLLLAVLLVATLVYVDIRRLGRRGQLIRTARPSMPDREQTGGRNGGIHQWAPDDMPAGLPIRERSGVPQ
jgi:hypothetical protein